jgi:hypothetical protein
MKRMYIVLGVFILIGVWAVSCLGQMTKDVQIVQYESSDPTQTQPFDRAKRRMELREKMHRRMMDKIINGNGPDQDLFKDIEADMEAAMEEAFSNMNSLGGLSTRGQNFKSEWSETASGRVLSITPQGPEQKLEIDTKPEMVTIKGQAEQKTPNGTSVSSFSNSFSIPSDCDGSKVKMSQKDGKIVMEFPYREKIKEVPRPRKNEGRTPLPPSQEDVTI